MSIVLEYLEISKKYQDIYGEKTILLFQVGSFFEIYSFIISKTNEISKISNIENVSEICNLNIARKSNHIGENIDNNTEDIEFFPSNPKDISRWVKSLPKSEVVMSGFRDYSLDKYVQILTDAGYITIVYVQDKNGKDIIRKLDHVYSPGTYISEKLSNVLSNNIISIWFERVKDKIIIGCSNVNIFTAQSSIFEYENEFLLNPTTFDELEKFISEFNPNELIITSNFQDESILNSIIQFIGVNTKIPIHFANIELKNEKNSKAINCTKETYICQIISTFFGDTAYNICDFKSNQIATQSFCYLLNFLQEHNPDLVRKIHLPTFTNTSNKLILANHTLRQLNIIDDDFNSKSSGHLSSVLSFLNRSCTAMGKRQFKYQLLNPIFDQLWLNKEYCMIDYILEKERNFIPLIRKQLQTVRDIEKINRQLVSNKLNPSTLYHLYKTVEAINEINNLYIKEDVNFTTYLVEDSISLETSSFMEFINSIFDIEKCQGVSTIDNNILRPNVSIELDELIQRRELLNNDIMEIKIYFNNLFKKFNNKEQEYIKIHETDKSGITFQMTKKRGSQLKDILSKIQNESSIIINDHISILLSDIKISTVGANDEIHFVLLNGLCKNLLKNQDEICCVVSKVYYSILTLIENNWYDKLESIAKYISRLDVIICKAFTSREYKYCKPTLSNDQDNSFVNCQGLRHVLIEHINTKEIYVDNDVVLDTNKQGFLLYGTNSAGKTTLIRALGIAVILAQSGNYVPCSSFIYKPYTAIFSRIQNNDNLFMGLSSFALEMSEIRTIIKQSDQNSLVLGDELCSSTDSISSISIFITTLIHLYEKNTSFIFATHLHEISSYDELKNMDRLNFKHLSVKYNQELDKLVYQRTLQNGTGNGNYGIEVAKSLHLPDAFIKKAYEIRNYHFLETIGDLSFKQSKYNALKLRSKCEICKDVIGEQIHHIKEQNFADENGYIGSVYKNNVANLMSLCIKCHQKQHSSS